MIASMRVVMLADLHYGNMAYENGGPFTENDHLALAREAHAAKPDIMVVAGDVADSMYDRRLLADALALYKNPHGASIMLPGNHDMWYAGQSDPEAQYAWNLEQAESNGWFALSDAPFVQGGVVIAGNMCWYDFSSSPTWLGRTPQMYEKAREWSDYAYMGLRSDPDPMPMTKFCRRRMHEFSRCLSKVPRERKALVVVTHVVGFEDLLGPLKDENTAYFGNFSIGEAVVRAKADLYYCGHTHARAESTHGDTRCVNNGSQYGHGTKRYDVFDF